MQAQWQNWLLAHHVPEGLSPEATLEFLAQVETARASRNEVERMRARVKAIENDITKFHDQLAPLAAAHDIPLDGHNRGRLGAPADNLIQRFDLVSVPSRRTGSGPPPERTGPGATATVGTAPQASGDGTPGPSEGGGHGGCRRVPATSAAAERTLGMGRKTG